MKLWMCRNCNGKYVNAAGYEAERPGKVFEAELPVCECGVDGRNPEHAAYISALVYLHFDPPHPFLKGRGTHEAACGAGRIGGRVNGELVYGTGERDAVNCKACRESEAFRGPAVHTGTLKAAEDPV